MAVFNTIPKFKFWCQKVLPLVYDDSLSYEELLCKVVDYLNHVIDDINAVPDYVKEFLSEDMIKELLSELMDEMREQICPENEDTKTTASKDRKSGDLVWLNGKLACITRDILAGTEYIEKTGTVGITGNFIYTTVQRQIGNYYDSDTQKLTICGWVDGNSQIVSRGDYHVYDGTRQAIDIIEVN